MPAFSLYSQLVEMSQSPHRTVTLNLRFAEPCATEGALCLGAVFPEKVDRLSVNTGDD